MKQKTIFLSLIIGFVLIASVESFYLYYKIESLENEINEIRATVIQTEFNEFELEVLYYKIHFGLPGHPNILPNTVWFQGAVMDNWLFFNATFIQVTKTELREKIDEYFQINPIRLGGIYVDSEKESIYYQYPTSTSLNMTIYWWTP